jgi:hypothetical protein
MEVLKDRRVLLGGGAALALIAGLGIALALMHGAKSPTDDPPASRGGLVVETGRTDDTKLDANRPLRCFVGAQQISTGKCEKPGGATYGRWGDETIRLVPGKVESSSDNRTFHSIIDLGPNCSIPSI